MKAVFALLAIMAALPALAADYAVDLPCDAAANGAKMIISRPPGFAEIAAEPPARPGFTAPALQMMRDHISCNGSAWVLDETVKQYSGVPQPGVTVLK